MGFGFIITALFALIPTLALGAPPTPPTAKVFQLNPGAGLFEHSGCLLISADGAEVGCIDHSLDMGFIDSTLRVFGASGPYTAKSTFSIYSGRSVFEAKGLDKVAMRKANAYLTKKRFTATGDVFSAAQMSAAVQVLGSAVIVSLSDKERGRIDARGMLPAIKSKRARLCCGWIPLEMVSYPTIKKVVVTFKQDCAWERLNVDKNDRCYDQDYCGDECNDWTPEQLLVLDIP